MGVNIYVCFRKKIGALFGGGVVVMGRYMFLLTSPDHPKSLGDIDVGIGFLIPVASAQKASMEVGSRLGGSCNRSWYGAVSLGLYVILL